MTTADVSPLFRWFRMVVAYDGTNYLGWQIQARGPTIQGVFERALKIVTLEEIRVTASGRTDSGVHALGQVVSFRSSTHHTPEVLLRAINGKLPDDIRVLSASYAPDGFHAIRDATSKRYRYLVQDGGVHDPFLCRTCWFFPKRLDLEGMRRGSERLLGTHDFQSYQSAGSPRATTVRTILDFRLQRCEKDLCDPICIEVEANGFLYNMVRNLVGTLVEVGRGLRSESSPFELLALGDRRYAGQTAPAKGLCLMHVKYAHTEFDEDLAKQ